MLKNEKESFILDSYLELFKKLYTDNLFIESMEDGKLTVVNEKNKKIEYTFGLITIEKSSEELSNAMVTYRNALRENIEIMKGAIDLTPDQLEKLGKGFAIIKDK